MAGLVPAIHVLGHRPRDPRGGPGQARAWRPVAQRRCAL